MKLQLILKETKEINASHKHVQWEKKTKRKGEEEKEKKNKGTIMTVYYSHIIRNLEGRGGRVKWCLHVLWFIISQHYQ